MKTFSKIETNYCITFRYCGNVTILYQLHRYKPATKFTDNAHKYYVFSIACLVFADNTNKKAFRKLSIILIFLIIIWFVFVQFMMALGKAFQH